MNERRRAEDVHDDRGRRRADDVVVVVPVPVPAARGLRADRRGHRRFR